MRTAIIVDMDGTLALMGDRSPYDPHTVHLDTPNAPVVSMVHLLAAAGHQVIVMSGRTEKARYGTATWLNRHAIPFHALHMRANGDGRPDALIKEELFRTHVEPTHKVVAVLDDRLSVCRMWHRLGLPLFRVGDPDADF